MAYERLQTQRQVHEALLASCREAGRNARSAREYASAVVSDSVAAQLLAADLRHGNRLRRAEEAAGRAPCRGPRPVTAAR